MNSRRTAFTAGLAAALLAACSGGGGGLTESVCNGNCQTTQRLETADVQQVIAQAVAEAQARGALATVAVVDRVGNVLGVFRMNGADTGITIPEDLGTRTVQGGVHGITVIPDTLAAIAKAITGAYLSSEGNAFSTRTASQIVQEFFNPGETNQPGGPLFGVQFSSLPCSDLVTRFGGGAAGPGPQRSPLGLSADPGGFPLYKYGALIGGVGVIADGAYAFDPVIGDRDEDLDELLATAASFGYAAPGDRRADRITVDGKTFRYSDVDSGDLAANPAAAPAFAALAGVGSLQAVPGYSDAAIRAGTAFGQPESGVRAAGATFAGLDAYVLVDGADAERYPPVAGTDGAVTTTPLSAAEVTEVLRGGLGIANRARAQIRRPLGSQVRVTISVVDTFGAVLGVARTRDAPVFGTDVSLQKARAAAFFSGDAAAADLLATPDTTYLGNGEVASIAGYVAPLRDAFGRSTLLADGSVAFADRSIGNLARPFFPDGLSGTPNGPLSKPYARWSPFSTGLQLDLVNSAIVQHVVFTLGGGADVASGACTQMPATPSTPSRLANGLQIFAGSVPIYRGDELVGAVGVSGDGIDQDDMVAFLGLHNAGIKLSAAIGNAPAAIRADQFSPRGTRLRFVQCPQAPFLDSGEQDVCQGK